MCGFCLSINDTTVDIHRLTESIRHRGPDNTRYFTGPRVLCGFNRLSIVDSDMRSDQPMLDTSGRYLLAFNGEIYNYKKLRLDLTRRHKLQFRTESDTEVLLYGLKHEGAKFVSGLDGIFAFAFVDLQSLEVILARDAFGVKPVYFYCAADRLYISSEIVPLQLLSGNKFQFSNIARYLSYGIVGSGEGIVCGVSELEPNTVKVFNPGQPVQTSTVHNFAYDLDESRDVDEIGNVLYQTIDSQKPAIPYGVLFSGGLDSTLILDRCFEDGNFSGAYSVDVSHPDMSEKRWQEYVVDALDIRKQYRRIELQKEDFSLENIAKISSGLDYPLFHPNFIGSFLLTRKAANDGLKVLISGEGADELFLGYRWFFSDQPNSDFLEYVPFEDICTSIGVTGAIPLSTSGMSILEVFQKKYLQRWLLRQDLTGMANSVEIRVPFLGLDLVDLLNKFSIDFKKGNGEGKWILKKLLAARFTDEFLQRKKVGFDFPLNDWIGEDHIDFLRQQNALIERNALNSILRKHEGSYMKNRIVFSLVSLSIWLDSFSGVLSGPLRAPLPRTTAAN